MKYILIWAYESGGQQRVLSITFDFEDVARESASALSRLAAYQLYSRVRLFRTPQLEELKFP